jgi:hypothetical protein
MNYQELKRRERCAVFIFTAKVNRKKLILGAVAAVLLCGAAIFAATALHARGAAALSTGREPTGVKTNDDRITYLASYGWTVESQPISVEELMIPQEFDDTYTQYLQLQASQGFDLTKYCGKRVKRYAYAITNYPTGEEGVQAGLLIYKNTVIGGEVLSPQLNGFIHDLKKPS